MTAIMLIQNLEQQGFKLSIFGKSRLRIHPSSAGYTAITPEIMAELVEKRPQIIEHLRARAAVQMASPQRPYEPPVIRVPGKPLTEPQLKFIEALTYADSVAQAGRIAGYGTRQASHKAYTAILNRMPVIRKALFNVLR
jgi:hypothetical protein